MNVRWICSTDGTSEGIVRGSFGPIDEASFHPGSEGRIPHLRVQDKAHGSSYVFATFHDGDWYDQKGQKLGTLWIEAK